MKITQLKKDVILFTIFLVIANLIQSQILHTPIFDDVWKLIMVGTYIGLFVYNTTIYRISDKLIDKVNKKECNMAIIDSVQYLTVIIFQYIIFCLFHGELIDFNNEWFVTVSITFICYAVFILVPLFIPSMDNMNDTILLHSLAKIGLSVLIYTYFISSGTTDIYPFLAMIPVIVGYSIYHYCNINNYFDNI
jgi:hypothetical protein